MLSVSVIRVQWEHGVCSTGVWRKVNGDLVQNPTEVWTDAAWPYDADQKQDSELRSFVS